MKLSKRNIFLIAILMLIAILLCINLFTGNRLINSIYETVLNRLNKSSTYDVKYRIYDASNSSNLKLLITFTSEEGIDYIKRTDGTQINTYGRKQVALDYIAADNEKLTFELKTKNGNEIPVDLNIVEEWNLTVESQNTSYGTVTNNSGIYKPNTQITVTATPANGYQLVGWSDGENIVSKEISYSFTMPKHDYQLTAIWISSNVALGEVLVYDEHTTFIVVRNPKTWRDAQNFAKSYGGRLAVIDCKEKQDLIYSKVRSIGDAWIGVTDEANEGVWLYTDGRPATIYSNWNSGEPNNAGNEDYAEMYMASGKWNDLNGTQSYPFIMELIN